MRRSTARAPSPCGTYVCKRCAASRKRRSSSRFASSSVSPIAARDSAGKGSGMMRSASRIASTSSGGIRAARSAIALARFGCRAFIARRTWRESFERTAARFAYRFELRVQPGCVQSDCRTRVDDPGEFHAAAPPCRRKRRTSEDPWRRRRLARIRAVRNSDPARSKRPSLQRRSADARSAVQAANDAEQGFTADGNRASDRARRFAAIRAGSQARRRAGVSAPSIRTNGASKIGRRNAQTCGQRARVGDCFFERLGC